MNKSNRYGKNDYKIHDRHLYDRLSNHEVLCNYIEKIQTMDIELAKILVGNITMLAQDHPKYPILVYAYQKRLQDEQHKKK